MRNIIDTVAQEIKTVLSHVKVDEAIKLAAAILEAKRIFVCGEGRSGLMGKAFAMRLMHGGNEVYVVGETITPSIAKGDLLVAISGSGSTGMIYEMAQTASKVLATVALVTTNPDSKIGQISSIKLTVPAATKFRHEHEPQTIQPLGNQFDQSVHLLLDAVIIYCLAQKKEGHDTLRQRHANLE